MKNEYKDENKHLNQENVSLKRNQSTSALALATLENEIKQLAMDLEKKDGESKTLVEKNKSLREEYIDLQRKNDLLNDDVKVSKKQCNEMGSMLKSKHSTCSDMHF